MTSPKKATFTIIFDGADGLWTDGRMFEDDILSFFRQLHMEPKMFKNLNGENAAEYMILLEKPLPVQNMPQPAPVSSAKQLSSIKKEIRNAPRSSQ